MKQARGLVMAAAVCVGAALTGGCGMQGTQKEAPVAVQAEEEMPEELEAVVEMATEVPEGMEVLESTGATEAVAESKDTELSDFPTATPDLIAIDYVDYEDGIISVYFKSRAVWTKPIVLVRDEAGNSYPAKVENISAEGCTIRVGTLENGKEYHFLLGGLSEKESKKSTTLTGYFEKPEIAPGA